MKRSILLFIFVFSVLFQQAVFSADKKYALLKLDGAVNPVVAEYLVDSIKKANLEKVQFIVIQMDTPGGLMTSMRDIIKAILTSDVPVVVFTSPKGAQAASAGGFIMLSAHIAVMAPGTEIGAMHPVSPMLDFMKKDQKGGPAGVMEKKVLNDTVAYARSLAQKRKRNVRWAEKAVRSAISNTYREAVKLGIIDFIAEDMSDLLKKLDKRKVDVNGRKLVLDTAGIGVLPFEMDWKQKLVNYFADPLIIFILFIIAIAGIGIEFKNPGMIFPVVLGAISLFIFLMAIQIIPINIAGLILIILAIVLFILELQFISYGFLTIGGIICFIAGSMILFDSPLPGGQVPISSIAAAGIFLMAFIFIVVRAVMNVHKTQVSTGKEGMIGETGKAFKGFTGNGKIRVHGEIWNAWSDEEVEENQDVVVEKIEGMTIIVKKK